jgi:hypothetical protein
MTYMTRKQRARRHVLETAAQDTSDELVGLYLTEAKPGFTKHSVIIDEEILEKKGYLKDYRLTDLGRRVAANILMARDPHEER